MGERSLSRLSDEALADCFGGLDSQRATLEALRKTVREEILRRGARRLVGRGFVVSVTSSISQRWHSEALAQELGSRAELFMYTFDTTYVRSRSISVLSEEECFGHRRDGNQNVVVNAMRR